LFNTFQLCLAKLDTGQQVAWKLASSALFADITFSTGSDEQGWDFVVEFNYETIRDCEDGYSNWEPNGGCASGTTDVTPKHVPTS
jgi:hypothetical protein